MVSPAAGDLDKNNLALSQFLIVSQHLLNVKNPAINGTLDCYIGRHAQLESLAAWRIRFANATVRRSTWLELAKRRTALVAHWPKLCKCRG